MSARRPVAAAALTLLLAGRAAAQFTTDITTDGSLPGQGGVETAIPGVGGVFEIGEPDGRRVGSTLFHSFGRFDVGTGDTAWFSANPALLTENIVGRVTGGMQSRIDGLIGADVAGANLFLLNPAGWLFGPNASLDLTGAFHAATADSLAFGDEAFEATLGGDVPVLAGVDPGDFGMLGNGAITVRSLALAGAPEIGLHGGHVSVEGAEIGAHAVTLEGATVTIDADSRLRSPDSGGSIEIRGGDLYVHGRVTGSGDDFDDAPDILIDGRFVEISRPDPLDFDGPLTISAESGRVNGGDVAIRGEMVVIRNSGIGSRTFATSSGRSGDIAIEAGTLLLEGSLVVSSGPENGDAGSIDIHVTDGPFTLSHSGVYASSVNGGGGEISIRGPDLLIRGDSVVQTSTFGSGDAGGIAIDVDSLRVESGGFVNSSSGLAATGDAGTITIRASESVQIVGEGELGVDILQLLQTGEGNVTGVAAITGGAGDAGSILIDAPSISIENGGVVAAFGGGGLSGPGGDAGEVTLTGDRIEVLGGGLVDSGSAFEGLGGNVSLLANERVRISGRSAGGVPSRVRSFNAGSDPGGDITIRAPRVEISDGGAVSTSTLDLLAFIVPLNGGAAGNVLVDTDSLVMSSGGRIESSSFSQGQGGRIVVDARDVSLTGADTGIFGQAANSGGGGTIEVGADDVEVLDGAAISTEAVTGLGASAPIFEDLVQGGLVFVPGTPTGDAGSVSIDAAQRIRLRDAVVSSGSQTFGNGGSLRLDAPKIDLDDAAITTRSTGSGDAGRIELNVHDLTLDHSRITAEAVGAFGGSISINGDSIETLPDGSLGAVVRPDQHSGDVVRLLDGSQIATSVGTGSGDGGNVLIHSKFVIFEDESSGVEATAVGGDGGNILLEADTVLAPDGDVASALDASSQSGVAGAVEVTAPPTNVIAGVDALDTPFTDPAELMRTPCAARDPRGDRSSFQVSRAGAGPEAAQGELDAPAEPLAAHRFWSEVLRDAEARDDPRALSVALGQLGGLYEDEHRTDEALRLTRGALHAAQRANAPDVAYRWHWQEGRLLWARGRASDALRAYRRAIAIVQQVRPEVRSGDFRRRVAPLYTDTVDALLESSGRVASPADAQRLLIEARATTEQLKAAELRDYFQDECVAELEAREIDIDRVSRESGAAIVYPVLLPDRTELLVSLPSGIERFVVPVGAGSMREEIARFRAGLENRSSFRYRVAARHLYDWLVAPYTDRLDAERITTLVFVPDGALRTVPMAALFDGERHLIERYALAVTPGLSLVDPTPLDTRDAEFLVAGLSQSVQGFEPLPNTAREVEAIHDMYGGAVLVDDVFRADAIASEIATRVPSVVHIATHAVFTGDPKTSFVLTWDDRIDMDRLAQVVASTQFRERDLELLALSACETAAGDDRAALGLAGVAIRAGAHSALGSLWPVMDEATSELFEIFYANLRTPGISKAEALRRAQRALLADPRFAHPYYWSAFLMINNWL